MAKADKEAKTKAKKGKKPKKPANKLANILGVQIALVIIGLTAILASIHFVSSQAMTKDSLDRRLQILTSSANALIQQSFSNAEAQLQKLSHDDDIYNAIVLQDMIAISDLENKLVNNFAFAESLKIIPWSDLGTAGIKQMGIQLRNSIETSMITKAASGNKNISEVYKIEKNWIISFATPIIHNEKPVGVLLLSTSSEFLEKALKQGVFAENGSLEIKQAGKTILKVGSPNPKLSQELKAPFDGGKIIISLSNTQQQKLLNSFINIYIIIAAVSLVFLIVPLVGFMSIKKLIENDLSDIKQYIKQSKGLHEGKRPNVKLLAFAPLVDEIHSLIQSNSGATAGINPQEGKSVNTGIDLPPSSTPPPAIPIEEVEEIAETSTFDAPQVFKEYDIRGSLEELSEANIEMIGKSIGSEVLNEGGNTIVIGHDSRSSSPQIANTLKKAILSTGCNTINLGESLSPTLYYGATKLANGCGVMVTGSHLDDNFNGFKIMINHTTLFGEQLKALLSRIENQVFESGEAQDSEALVDSDYSQEIANDIITARGLNIVIDEYNMQAAGLANQLLTENDCELITVNSGGGDTCATLSAAVNENNSDFGIGFDSDADRLIVVSNSGEVIENDKLIMLFAQDISSRNPGSSIVYDIKCSRELGGIITQAGSRPVMYKAGHSNIKHKMSELDAVFAGEYTGHFYFKDRWYGFDDGIYAAMRLAELISSSSESIDERLAQLPQTATSPEYVIPVSSEEKKHEIVSFIANAMEAQQGEKIHIDGFRIEFEAGWGLVRASNTSQAITLRFEANDADLLGKLQTLFKAGLNKADETLAIPF